MQRRQTAFAVLGMLLGVSVPIQLVFACSSDGECSGRNEICSITVCKCKQGYTKNSNGTCITEESAAKEDSKSVYKALVAVFAVLIIIAIISMIIFFYIRRRKAYLTGSAEKEEHHPMTNLKHKPSIRQILGEYNEERNSHHDSASATEEDFERLVQSLREDAQVFLKMINEVKRKLNMLDDKNTTQGMQYKALIRDLSRVLHILNKKPAKLEMPSDGVPLLLWAENALKRFEYVESQNPQKRDKDIYGECSTATGTHDAVL